MPHMEQATQALHGRYRDRLWSGAGELLHDGGWHGNVIVLDCRRILASFMGGNPALGIQGMLFGGGDPAWDGAGGAPVASPATASLVDPAPFLVPAAALQVDFIDDLGVVVATATNRLQIIATLGPGLPPWPDGAHIAGSLREFALLGDLNGAPGLINYVIHPVINKDAAGTLERTVWLVF